MKKTKFLISRALMIISLISLFSCSSDDNSTGDNGNSNYYIKAKINGELTEYKFEATASFPLNDNRISGYAKATPNQPFPAFDFEIIDPTGIKVKNYIEPNNDMIFRLSIEGMVTYHSLQGDVDDFNINITEITNNHVKGTFGGKIFLAQSNDGSNFTVTEGEFFLKRDLE